MLYSVWDPIRHVYVYYRGPALPYGDVPTPRHLRSQALGTAADEAAWPLPRGAVRIGGGREARGMIATSGVGPPTETGWLILGGLLIAGYSLTRIFK